MLTDVQIINLGLSKIASGLIASISPPRTKLEAYMAGNYPHWKRRELTKRRWVFAVVDNYPMTATTVLSNVDQPNVYPLPNDCLRPIRLKGTEWKQRGRNLYSNYDNGFTISYIRNAPETDFDPLFEEVLAAAVAVGCCEYVTQSTSKSQMAAQWYKDAIEEAGQANAFIIGPESIYDNNAPFEWEAARFA